MTIDSILKELLEGKILESIKVSEAFEEFVNARLSEPEIHSEEYQKWLADKERIEAEFLDLYTDKELGRKKVLEYNGLSSYMETDLYRQYYKRGLYDTLALLFPLTEVLRSLVSSGAIQLEALLKPMEGGAYSK